jgi:nucleoside-diphosphate-sugar epimerase
MPLDADIPTILLLGGSGFIGQAVLRAVARKEDVPIKIRALLRNPRTVPDYKFLEKIEGSLEDLPQDLEPAEPYVLVHLAVKQIDTDRTGYRTTNVDATRTLLKRLGPKLEGILYGSSMSVYGQGEQAGIREGHKTNPETPLARSRREAEIEIQEHGGRRQITTFLLRPRFTIGEGDRFVLPALHRMASGQITISDKGQSFSIIDVDDYARIILRLIRAAREQRRLQMATQEPLHIAYADPLTLDQVMAVVREHAPQRTDSVRIRIGSGIAPLLRKLPSRRARQMATQLELLGVSHWGDSSALVSKIGADIVGKSSLLALKNACVMRDAAIRTPALPRPPLHQPDRSSINQLKL